MTALDRRTFLDIMGTLPNGVTVVTTIDQDGRPHGLTVSAVCSVSPDPPLLLVCIDARSRTLASLRTRGGFVVNFLRGDREGIARRFSSPIADRFEGVEWRAEAGGLPVLFADSLSFAVCRTVQDLDVGDHVMLIGRVEAGSPPPPLSRPLTYFRRRYDAWPGEVVRDGGAVDAGPVTEGVTAPLARAAGLVPEPPASRSRQ